MLKSKKRLLELNSKLAQILLDKGVSATANDTTTELVDKVEQIQTNNYLASISKLIMRSITELEIPDSVTRIGSGAFHFCQSLTSITIPDGVKSIGYAAFSNCTSLKSVTIPDSVTLIDVYAFSECRSLTEITIPNSVRILETYSFSGCVSLTNLTIENGVTTIGDYAFSSCKSLTSITISDNVTSMGRDVFSSTAWYNNQPDGLVYAGKVAYKYKGDCPSEVIIKDGTKESITTLAQLPHGKTWP